MPYGWIFAYIIGNICMSAVTMSLRWANRGPWASCFYMWETTLTVWEDTIYFHQQKYLAAYATVQNSDQHTWADASSQSVEDLCNL